MVSRRRAPPPKRTMMTRGPRYEGLDRPPTSGSKSLARAPQPQLNAPAPSATPLRNARRGSPAAETRQSFVIVLQGNPPDRGHRQGEPAALRLLPPREERGGREQRIPRGDESRRSG